MPDQIQRQMAKGAAWMVLFRLIERSIGLISTLILARLLSPADFGVVAMALSFLFLAEQMTALGFDVALIQNRNTTRAHLDSAWTCTLILGLCVAVVILAAAFPIARFYDKPDLVWVVATLTLHPILNSIRNVGVVAFRKELDFRKEFWFQVLRKVFGFVVTVPAAFLLRNYWALVIGMLASQVATVVISYVMHPFRPKLDLSRARELLGFSKWLLMNNLVSFFKDRSTDFFIGRLFGANSLGIYNIAVEFAHLPSTELSMPINRALLPGFAKMETIAAVVSAYERALGMMAMLAVPCAAGLAALAPFFVPTVLGSKWIEATPLIQIMAFNGALLMFHSPTLSVMVARGHPKMALLGNSLYVALLLLLMSGLYFLHMLDGLQAVAVATVATTLLSTPTYLYLLKRKLRIGPMVFLRAVMRPAVAALLMAATLHLTLPVYDSAMPGTVAAAWLLGGVGAGGVLYVGILSCLWLLAGRPKGPESMALDRISRFARPRGV